MDTKLHGRTAAAGATALIALLALSGCSTAAEPDAEPAQNLGTLKSGEVSMAFMNGLMPYIGLEGDALTGVEGDLFQIAADEMNLDVNAQGMEFSAMIAGVQAGRYDIGVGGIAWTEARAEAGIYSDPIYYSPALLLTAPGVEISTIEDMDGLHIGAATGSMNDDAVRATPGAIPHSYPAWSQAITDLEAGRLDAVNIDPLTAVYVRDTRPDLKDFGTSVITAPSDAEVEASPGLMGYRPYQVVWYCSPKAEKLCDEMSTQITDWYSGDVSFDVLTEWGVDAESFLVSTPAMSALRQGMDRPDDWTAPTRAGE